MKKYLVIGFIIIIALGLTYLTFLINVIQFEIGAILLGVSVISLIIVWILWKVKKD